MTQTLLPAVDAFLRRSGMSPVTFGRSAMNDPHFVRDLRNGRRIWPETDQKVREFIAEREHSACTDAQTERAA